jgi:hypothetical protein
MLGGDSENGKGLSPEQQKRIGKFRVLERLDGLKRVN